MESSRKTESSAPLAPGGCPRCGIRLGEPYKYCPNCAYRLRPDLFPTTHAPAGAPPVSQRLVAVGGYLLFAAMLLLVVFAGVRLFAPSEPANPVQPQVIRARDPGCLALTLDEFVEVPAGIAFYGLYDPGREPLGSGGEAAGEAKKEAELAEAVIAELADETIATPDEIAEARRGLREAIASHASISEAIRAWADGFTTVVPHDPVAGIPDAWEVETPFRMAKREVTNDQYFEFLRAWARKTGKPVPPHLLPTQWKLPTGSRDVRKIYNEREGDFPVVGIPFDAALEFCGWFWQERLGGDPDLVVDLPTWKEFVLAARGDRLTYNFPWGRTLLEARKPPNIGTDGLWSVTARKEGKETRPVAEEDLHNGFLDLVGNAKEWVYWVEDAVAAAAGWSFEDAWVGEVYRGQPSRAITPFSMDGFRPVHPSLSRTDVGFRPVIRRAASLPAFVAVAAGVVRHGPGPEGLLPPERLDAEGAGEDEAEGHETIEQILRRREPPVTFAAETAQVTRAFDIAATEITNRQYLAFLASIAPAQTKDEMRELVPGGWRWESLFVPRNYSEKEPVPRAFRGYHLPRESLDVRYAPGEENVPVQGIRIDQAERYASWLSSKLGRRCGLPTAAQYLRAGRGDGLAPYPWGDDLADRELAPSRPLEETPRAFALAPTDARPVVGLAGNVAELVRDGDRLLLAGGFYDLPARFVTLDCFLDANWTSVQFVHGPEEIPEDEEAPLRPRLSSPRILKYYTGFRVVRLPDPF